MVTWLFWTANCLFWTVTWLFWTVSCLFCTVIYLCWPGIYKQTLWSDPCLHVLIVPLSVLVDPCLFWSTLVCSGRPVSVLIGPLSAVNFSVSLSRAHCKLHVVVTCLYIFCLQVVAGGPSGPAIMRSTDSYSLTSRSGDIKLFYKLPFLFCGLKKICRSNWDAGHLTHFTGVIWTVLRGRTVFSRLRALAIRLLMQKSHLDFLNIFIRFKTNHKYSTGNFARPRRINMAKEKKNIKKFFVCG